MYKLCFWRYSVVSFDLLYKINRIKNNYQIPIIKTIKLNIFSKSIINDQKKIIFFLILLKLLTNQQPTVYKSRKSISNLKLRKGMLLGSKISLHKWRAMDFFFLLCQLSIINTTSPLKNKFYQSTNLCGSISLSISKVFLFPQLHFIYDKFPIPMAFFLNMSINFKNNSKISGLFCTAFSFKCNS